MEVKLDVKLHIVLTISVHLRIATVKAQQKSVKYLCALMLQSLKLSCEFLVGLEGVTPQCNDPTMQWIHTIHPQTNNAHNIHLPVNYNQTK